MWDRTHDAAVGKALAIAAHLLEAKARIQRRPIVPDDIDNDKMVRLVRKLVSMPDEYASAALDQALNGNVERLIWTSKQPKLDEVANDIHRVTRAG